MRLPQAAQSLSHTLPVIYASFEAAYQEARNQGSLNATGSASGAVTRKKVGELEVQYAGAQSDGTASFLTPLISTVDGMLAPYLRDKQASRVWIGAVG
ncbi:DnaT-like ssDNA-binding protein [Pseudochrobactrum sp. sp1633]|uniref:DnaT-like ssDNA-binding protein n=1 Tax=Pseudochrobactrum sp. sp1633 TaxID=3036706 RepID=UPI0027E47A41|nr:DnaT-like ssDNA-binding protein [Pseudochrobactrum sp. sp1633]